MNLQASLGLKLKQFVCGYTGFWGGFLFGCINFPHSLHSLKISLFNSIFDSRGNMGQYCNLSRRTASFYHAVWVIGTGTCHIWSQRLKAYADQHLFPPKVLSPRFRIPLNYIKDSRWIGCFRRHLDVVDVMHQIFKTIK